MAEKSATYAEFMEAVHDACVLLWRRTDLTPQEREVRRRLTTIKNQRTGVLLSMDEVQ